MGRLTVFSVQFVFVFLFPAGTFGTVSVEWFVDRRLTTAVQGVDFIADGATLAFQPHESLKGLTSFAA